MVNNTSIMIFSGKTFMIGSMSPQPLIKGITGVANTILVQDFRILIYKSSRL